MRVRWIAVTFAIGMFFAWRHQSWLEAYITTFFCLLLWALRRLEGEIRRLREAIEAPRYGGWILRDGPDSTYKRPRIPDGGMSHIYAGDSVTRDTKRLSA
jgi:hypothetical protein